MVDQLNLEQFRKIYDKTYSDVLKYIVCKCSNMDDVNDILQETYLEFYKALARGKKILDSEKYIMGIAKNKAKRYYTLLYKMQTISLFGNKEEEVMLLDTLKSDVDIEKIILTGNDLEGIWNYLKSKKVIIQKIFYLYYELDMPIKQIAQQLDVNQSYVKNALYRTLKELQEFWGKDCD